MAEGMTETKQAAVTALSQEIMREYSDIPADQQPFYSVFAFTKGLRRAEEIAINAGKNALNISHANMSGLIVDAIRAEWEKLEGEHGSH